MENAKGTEAYFVILQVLTKFFLRNLVAVGMDVG